MNIKTKYLIIGNSVAGVSCVEGIREADSKGKIVVVSDEGLLNYSRPLISYYLGKKVKEDAMAFRDEGFYEENKVELLLKTKVEKIDLKKMEVCTDKGRIGFQKLLIATGGRPITPSIEGRNKANEGVFTFTKFSDAEAIAGYIKKNKSKEAVVLGAGLIGLKCTEGLVGQGLSVTIVELADKILANTFDKKASGILENGLKEKGCRLIKEGTITKIESTKGKISKVVLSSGKEIPTNLLILSIGVKPDMDLAKEAGIDCDRGIVVDGHMQTSIKNVYAAGDVACGLDFLTGENSVIAIWPVASRQGRVAGLNMADRTTEYRGLFAMNSVELAGIATVSFGLTNPADDEGYEVLLRKEPGFYRKIIIKDNRIVGAIFLGRIERAGIFLGLIKDRIDVSSFKESLTSDDFGLLVLPKEYRKHLVVGEGIEV